MSMVGVAVAQGQLDLKPDAGLRENPPTDFLLNDAVLVRGPEFYSESDSVGPAEPARVGDVLVRQGVIVEVGESIEPPPGCRVIDCTDKSLYAGWINAWHEVGSDDVTSSTKIDDYWNANIAPLRKVNQIDEVPQAAKLRSQGFTTSVLAPPGRILGGRPSVWSLNEKDLTHPGPQQIADTEWMTAAMTVPRPNDAGEAYPRSPMGAYALLRQALYDAKWHVDAVAAYEAKTTLPRPNSSATLAALASDLSKSVFVFDCPNERMILRGQRIAEEFSVRGMMRGSGREYRDLEGVVKASDVILVPLDFPSKPNVTTPQHAREVELRELLHWKFAPSNPAKLIESGVSVCLTTDRLKEIGDFLPNLRKAVDHGLSRRDAIASLTTVPAKLLGIDQTFGRIESGMQANLVLTDGDLFEKKSKIATVFVAGQEFEVVKDTSTPWQSVVGSWKLPRLKRSNLSAQLDLQENQGRVSVKFVVTNDAPSKKKDKKKSKQAKAKSDEDDKEPKAEFVEMVQRSDQIAGLVDFGDALKQWCDEAQVPLGKHRVLIRTTGKTFSDIRGDQPLVFEIYPIGSPRRVFTTTRKAIEQEAEEDDKAEGKEKIQDSKDDSGIDERESKIAIVHPLGVYGRQSPVPQSTRVLFRGAVLWTCEDRSDLPIPNEPMDVLVEDGKITRIDERILIDKDDDCVIVDARGQHMTPGLIDCHSHIATDGGINEAGQVVTAEVRIGDFLDPSDITIYRQLAGGVTTANILHGSANPIGGQNQVIKFRWGDPMEALRFDGAPAGIKFALGENVKRLASRYPNTRMGVEQLLRDQFLAAREYKRAHRRWDSGMREALPPRVDLQMEAIAEVQDGTRWIHCHSYRQDEIVATLDVLEEFGIRIGSLQHILEGYKVADRMARHGAMASSFADWWAYKFEVYDAIPYNGAVMHNAGVIVSFNSDDKELGRHLNTEAAKAVKYGGVSPTEALKFVTLNPAKQLRIEHQVGSIEVGKDADLVLWNGPPLSTTSRCQQTWVDGRPMFDLDDDQSMHQRDEAWRNELIQTILNGESKSKPDKSEKTDVDEEDRWLRYDEFCNTRGGQQGSRQGLQQENAKTKTARSGDSQ